MKIKYDQDKAALIKQERWLLPELAGYTHGWLASSSFVTLYLISSAQNSDIRILCEYKRILLEKNIRRIFIECGGNRSSHTWEWLSSSWHKEALLALGQVHEIDLKITSALYQSLANKEWSEGERNEKAPPFSTKPPTECWISDTWRFNDAVPRMTYM